jgi:hypothetical protein
MRPGQFIAGLVLFVIGLLLVVAFLLSTSAQNTTVPAGSDLELTNTRYTATTLSVQWSGQPSATVVYLVSSTASPTACSSPQHVVTTGSGSNGSLSASLAAGAADYVYGCSGSSFASVRISVSQSGGVNAGQIFGGVLATIGVLLILLGLRRQDESDRFLSRSSPSMTFAPVSPRGTRPRPVSQRRVATNLAKPYQHGPPTQDGRTLRGCRSCGKVSPTGTSDRCPACGAPY